MTTDQNTAPLDLDGLERALAILLPVAINNTPDYAEVTFGTAVSQTMTMEPDTFLALNALPALISQAREAERMRGALEAKLTDAKINCDGSDESVTYTSGVIDTYRFVRQALAPATGGGE